MMSVGSAAASPRVDVQRELADATQNVADLTAKVDELTKKRQHLEERIASDNLTPEAAALMDKLARPAGLRPDIKVAADLHQSASKLIAALIGADRVKAFKARGKELNSLSLYDQINEVRNYYDYTGTPVLQAVAVNQRVLAIKFGGALKSGSFTDLVTATFEQADDVVKKIKISPKHVMLPSVWEVCRQVVTVAMPIQVNPNAFVFADLPDQLQRWAVKATKAAEGDGEEEQDDDGNPWGGISDEQALPAYDFLKSKMLDVARRQDELSKSASIPVDKLAGAAFGAAGGRTKPNSGEMRFPVS